MTFPRCLLAIVWVLDALHHRGIQLSVVTRSHSSLTQWFYYKNPNLMNPAFIWDLWIWTAEFSVWTSNKFTTAYQLQIEV